MSTYQLDAFLNPASVAVIGASRLPASVGATVARNLASFPGRVFRVNRNLALDADAGVYPQVNQLPEAPDLAVIAVSARNVPAVVADLGKLGTRAAIVMSSGLSDTSGGESGRKLRDQMLAGARVTGMRILGPNSSGVLAPHAGLNAGFAHALPPPGRLALLSQSGAVLTTVSDWASARGIGFSALVSLGEMAEVDAADWLDYLATNVQTQAILLYLESIVNARKFMSAARQASRLKPVIALKSGRSPVAAKAAALHSGALAGSDPAFDAAFRRAGIQRVPTLMQMLEAAETLTYAQPLEGDALAIISNDGGMGVLAADELLDRRGRLSELSDATQAALDEVVPAGWSHNNPVDILGDAGPDRYRATLKILLEAPEVDAVAVMYSDSGLSDPAAVAKGITAELQESPRHKPILAAWLGPFAGKAARTPLADLGIPAFDTPEALIRGFLQLAERRRLLSHLSETVLAFPLRGKNRRDDVRRMIEQRLGEGVEWLDEVDSKHLLALAGFTVNETRRARTPDEARAVARSMQGPYVVKILSPDLLHKNNVHGVTLDVESADAVKQVAENMLERLHASFPSARLEGVTVQRMINRSGAQEVIAGVTRDPIFGPMIVFGAGGVAVDAKADTALALPPLNVNLARDLIEQTRMSRVLAGADGQLPPVDMDALVALLIRVSELVCEFPQIAELDINPVLAAPDGVTALDAHIRLQRPHGSAYDQFAIMPYPRDLEQPFTLPDGTRCLLRPIRPEDEIPLRKAFLELSPESRYMRMFATVGELPHVLAARATQIDYDREMAFVISEDKPAGEATLYGGVRLITDANRESGEFAITVIDRLAGHGIGRRLMEIIIDYGRKIGLREIFGDVLAENRPMLAICRDLGFKIEPGEEGTVVARLKLK